MKRLNKKLLTFVLAGLCVATAGAATINVVSSADEAEGTAISSVFTSSTGGGKIDVETATGAETGTLRFTLANGKSVALKRDLALKWYEDVEGTVTEKYMDMKFSFKNKADFKTVTFKMESASTVVTENNKAENEVVFSVENGELFVAVNGGAKSAVTSDDISLSLAKAGDDTLGSFDVKVNGNKVGTFTDVGANYADYTASKMIPLSFKAETEGEKEAVLLFKELNGQKFDAIKDEKVADTAAPVLVLNQEISSFQFGAAFSLNYEKIDVLQDSGLTETIYYYQYNPADTEVKYENKLTTTTYFMDTVYYTDGTNFFKQNNEAGTLTATSVRAKEGKEYVSVKVALGDGKNSKDYYLSWYANATESKTLTKEGTPVATDYIVIDENTDGAEYKYLVADETTKTNKYTENGVVGSPTEQDTAKEKLLGEVEKYEDLLAEEAKETKASGDSYIKLPALDWLITDNGGYRGLRFTISYKTPSSATAKSATNLQYNGLKFSISEEGQYEFKVFANDVAGNTMKYYVEDELVTVNATNIWDIEEIPSFKFTIADQAISIKEDVNKTTEKRVEKILDSTYTLSGITVQGAKDAKSLFALYRFDDGKYGKAIGEDTLLKVTYEKLITKANASFSEVGKGKKFASYLDLYVHTYAAEIAELIKGATPTDEEVKAVKDCFVKIEAYNAEITEENDKTAWEAYNQYKWDESSKSFKAVEEGNYFIFADYYEDYLPTQRAAAYKLIVVDSKADVIKGESQFAAWIKNNVLSVVLFGLAGLMLIAIVILLLVHPSEETLEDVDAEAAAKKANKKKKDE